MYERNAIVIDRYFASIFGYDGSNNIKNNSTNYFELVKQLENYQDVYEIENNIMQEFEIVANQIKETQKLQEVLNKRGLKYNENRKTLFESLDEDPSILSQKFEKLSEEINKNNEEIQANAEKFVEEIREFNEKSETRSNAGKERRLIENDYQKILNHTTDNFNNISKEKLKEIKNFLKAENKTEAKEIIKEKILKNGSKEKVPFDVSVIWTAIDVSTDLEQKRAEILMSLYDKTMRLLDEIRKDEVKIERHKKIVKDSKSKLEFLNVISEYVILFLDNERMNTMGGETEHHKIMTEACQNLQSDLIEIQNMYSLLVKEITGKTSKKAYKELYNPDYLVDLQEDEKKFEKDISKLNMMGNVVYPDYWRVEGMQKIYETFKNILTNVYEKDLTEYEPLDITFDVKEEMLEDEDEDEEVSNEQIEENIEVEVDEEIDEPSNEPDENEDDEFHWDDEEDDDELNFGSSNYILDEEDVEGEEKKDLEDGEEVLENEEELLDDEEDDTVEEKEISEESKDEEPKDEESERDKEIDEILGFFDNEEDLDEEDDTLLPGLDEEEEEILDIEDEVEDEENDKEENEILDDDRIFGDEDETEKNEEEKKPEKRRGLFGRRKK